MANNRVGQRYQVGDRVKKKTVSSTLSLPPLRGAIVEVQKKENKLKHPVYYYKVKWDEKLSSSIHAQHALLPLSD
jgi:putative ribosome biogenesis GTPase RsgA